MLPVFGTRRGRIKLEGPNIKFKGRKKYESNECSNAEFGSGGVVTTYCQISVIFTDLANKKPTPFNLKKRKIHNPTFRNVSMIQEACFGVSENFISKMGFNMVGGLWGGEGGSNSSILVYRQIGLAGE